MRHPLAIAVVPVAFLALLAAGCGGGDGGSTSSSSETTPTEEWAGSLCTAIMTWTDSLTSSVNSLQSGNLSKDSLQGIADDAKSSTETLVDDIKGLGRPDTEAGAEAQDALNSLADDLQKDVDEIESAVNDSSANLVSTIATVTRTIVTMGNQLSATFNQLEDLDAKGEMQDAFEQADSCQELTS